MNNCVWVLLRGWTREQRHWNDFPKLFVQENLSENHSAESQIICLDLPGTGTENSATSPMTIEEITDGLKTRLDSLKLPDSLSRGVIGISMGGMIALDWAARFPGDFSKMVLINSSLGTLSRPWQRFNLSQLPRMLPILVTKDDKKAEEIILSLTSALPRIQQKKIAEKFAQIRNTSKVSKSTLFRQLVAAKRFGLLRLPKTPALVITSKQDQLVYSRCSSDLAAALDAKLATHPSAGHDLPLDDPKWLAETIVAWANELDTRRN